MRKLSLALVAAGVVLASTTPALARDGCGRAFHRGYQGRCVPNRGPVYAAPRPSISLVIGSFYPGRGYWDGRRYWGHRDRWRGGWRYR